MPAPTFSQLVGTNVRRIRTEAGATQTDLARQMVELGVPWVPSRVSQLESGEASPTLPLMMLLAAALDRLSETEVTVADLLSSEDLIELASGVRVPRSVVVEILAGRAAGALWTYRRDWNPPPSCDGWPINPPGVDPREDEAYARFTRADERAAKAVGVDRRTMVRLAVRLWGHNLSAERDRLAAAEGISIRSSWATALTRRLRAEAAEEYLRMQDGDPGS